MNERAKSRRERNLFLTEGLVAIGVLVALYWLFAPGLRREGAALAFAGGPVFAAAPEIRAVREELPELHAVETSRAPAELPRRPERSLDARVALAVSELADALRAEHFDLATWDCSARATARRLGSDSRDVLAARLGGGEGTLEERVSAAELALLLEHGAVGDPARLPPPIEAELLGVILAHESEPRLAAVAARAHAALGSPAALRFWIDAASGTDDPGLAALALRALRAVRGEDAANEILGALETASDDGVRERLVIALGAMARAGGAARFARGAEHRSCDALMAVALDQLATPSLRRRARNALTAWGCDGPRGDGVSRDELLVLGADVEQDSQAIVQVFDLTRVPAERRRDASRLALQGAPAEHALARILLHDPAAEVRSAAAVALGRGERCVEGRSALEQASANDPSLAVRRQAEQALADR